MTEFRPWTEGKVYPKLEQIANEFCTTTYGTKDVPINRCKQLSVSTNPLWSQAFLIAKGLNVTGIEPQELDILGSAPGNYCLVFLFQRKDVSSDTFGHSNQEVIVLGLPLDPLGTITLLLIVTIGFGLFHGLDPRHRCYLQEYSSFVGIVPDLPYLLKQQEDRVTLEN